MSDIIIYNTADGKANIKFYADNGTAWLTQAQIAELFETSKSNINEHIRHIFEEGELIEPQVIRKLRTTAADGKSYNVAYYNLDVILAVGFRVRSPRGTQFRQWANSTLKEYLNKGFVLDAERLKNPDGRPDYFDELLAQIRDIRASEKRFYQKIKDLFALSTDYIPTNADTIAFFKQTQNQLLYAVTGLTAPEIIRQRADQDAPNMGLTSWQGKIVRKGDIHTAKNYLKQEEIDNLNRLVSIFLDSAELRAKMRKTLTLQYWREAVGKLLAEHEFPILATKGSISKVAADAIADREYEAFEMRRRIEEARQADADDLAELQLSAKEIKRDKA